MTASYPTSVKTFAGADQDLDKDTAIRIAMNEVQQEVTAIETALKGTAALATVTATKINTTGGIHVGGTSDAGTDNLVVDGTTNLIGALSLNGTLITPSPSELNLVHKNEQNITDAGTTAINIKNGIVCLKATDIINATLANPVDGTDDGSRLLILSETAKAHTVTVTGGFGNGGEGEDVATFGAIGDTLELMAYNGYWYIVGSHQVTVA
jgi:hypothetical protein